MKQPRRDVRHTLRAPIVDMTNTSKSADRRHGADIVVRAISWCSYASWALTVIVFLVIGSAKPAGDDFFSRLLDTRTNHYWSYDLLQLAAWLMLACFLLCLVGIILCSRRNRRRTDRLPRSLVVICIGSLMGATLSFFLFF